MISNASPGSIYAHSLISIIETNTLTSVTNSLAFKDVEVMSIHLVSDSGWPSRQAHGSSRLIGLRKGRL